MGLCVPAFVARAWTLLPRIVPVRFLSHDSVDQRIFFLHNGRTTDRVQAIRAHQSAGNRRFGPSEATQVIDNFNALSEDAKQDLLNFLRSL